MRKSIALTFAAMLGMILVGCSSNSASSQPLQKQQTTPSQNQIQAINPSQLSENIQSTATSYPNLSRFQMLDADDGFAWGATNNRFQIEKTADEGIHWQSVSNKLQLPQFLKRMQN